MNELERRDRAAAWRYGLHDEFLAHPLVAAHVSLRSFGDLTRPEDAMRAEIETRTLPGAKILVLEYAGDSQAADLRSTLPDRCVERLEPLLCDLRELEPGSLDLVIDLAALCRVRELEGAWSALHAALRPRGAVLAREYVGPDSLRFDLERQELCGRVLAKLVPAEHKVHHAAVTAELAARIHAQDPSVGLRASDVLVTCEQAGFSIEGHAHCGCALLHPILIGQIQTYDPQNWEHNLVLSRLILEETRLMKAGRLGDDFAMFVACPR